MHPTVTPTPSAAALPACACPVLPPHLLRQQRRAGDERGGDGGGDARLVVHGHAERGDQCEAACDAAPKLLRRCGWGACRARRKVRRSGRVGMGHSGWAGTALLCDTCRSCGMPATHPPGRASVTGAPRQHPVRVGCPARCAGPCPAQPHAQGGHRPAGGREGRGMEGVQVPVYMSPHMGKVRHAHGTTCTSAPVHQAACQTRPCLVCLR